MMSRFFAFSLLLTTLCGTKAATIRGANNSEDANAVPTNLTQPRRLEIIDFVKLDCNAGLNIEDTTSCVTWSSMFGTSESFSKRIEIPCGQCVEMDYSGDLLILNGGIDVHGKLVFPDNSKSLEVRTPIVAVQGQLKMTSTKPVDGNPLITFRMIGQDAMKFTPILNNANKCNGDVDCDTGKKAIVVAGGQVDINGLPADTPTWLNLYDVTGEDYLMPDAIVVKDSVRGKWMPGAEILITSHTRVWNEQQQRTIKEVKDAKEDGYVELVLTEPIIRPTTMVEWKDFAVEVALLSRNIVFDAGNDNDPIHGGHFWIFHTPTIVQSIVGIDVQHFGQQGNLGRYPIHFHFCSDVPNSKISKNTIRHAFQRCIVVHGTNQLEVSENIAFDTAGHCFFTEDGIETNNKFLRNLGAQTAAPRRILVNQGEDETDSEPATFWMSNPTNILEGNVAAGSQSSGYWIEPVLRGDRADQFKDRGYDPRYEPLGVFDGNVAHSTGDPNDDKNDVGAVRTYASDRFHEPRETAIFRNMKVYRNNNIGFMLHKNHNYIIEDSLFADNNINVDVDRTDGVLVRRVKIIGESDSYRELMARQDVGPVCGSNSRMVGIDMHTWTLYNRDGGGFLENISISGFDDKVACRLPHVIHVDFHNIEENQFEFYGTFRKIRLEDGPESISFCDVDERQIDTVHYVDLDGSLSPSGVLPSGASTLLGSSPEINRFVDQSKCTKNENGCYKYCTNTCFRSIRFETQGFDMSMDGFILKACKTDEPANCSEFKGGRRNEQDPRSFIAHLPVGSTYNLVFLDRKGRKVEPSADGFFRYDFNVCPAASGVFSVTFDGEPIPNLEPALTMPPIPKDEEPFDPPTDPSPEDPPKPSPEDPPEPSPEDPPEPPASSPDGPSQKEPTDPPASSPDDKPLPPQEESTDPPASSPDNSDGADEPSGVFEILWQFLMWLLSLIGFN